jgi:hypothetical protein
MDRNFDPGADVGVALVTAQCRNSSAIASAGAPERYVSIPTGRWGYHRRRIPDRIVFEHVVDALAHGSAQERLRETTSLRRRRQPPAQPAHQDFPQLIQLTVS